jgi:flavin reductase (DIM6/NTAB) family NADH-FMN oxidoreductase RutF
MSKAAERGLNRDSDGPAAARLPDVDANAFRAALGNLATAVSVLATDGPAGRAGMTCSAVCAISPTPPTILACVHSQSAAHAAIKANGVLAVSILGAKQSALSQLFAGVGNVPMEDRFASESWCTLATGAPCYREALGAIDAVVIAAHDVGTHSVFVARVVAVADSTTFEPLIHHRRAYATTHPV